MGEKIINIDLDQNYFFHNQVDYCVGTGRMGLALQKEYQEQLAFVQSEIGFSYIRGHGLFSDDMAIYQEYEDANGNLCVEYNYTYLDLVFDSYKDLSIKPFLELGFMPKKLASGTQTVFYWKGNTTPPKSYEKWCDLVKATLMHLIDRYGINEVLQWPIEVWNEPNLPGFWEHADMQEYFILFKETFFAIKSVNPRFRVGGPAICGVDDENWIRSFMTFCQQEEIPVDFITRHHYTTELPEYSGHYGYAKLSEAEFGFCNLQTTRDIVDSFPEYKGIQIHITEFNTSYIPNCPLHDTNRNAAFIAEQLSRLGDMNESYSYWTFGDIFEEHGVPFTPFHGGFGMVANRCIPKPTFWTFKFYKELKKAGDRCVFKDEHCVIVKNKHDQGYTGILWNKTMENEGDTLNLSFSFPMSAGFAVGSLTKHIVDENTCNPLKAWHNMGEPSSLTDKQEKYLKEVATPSVEVDSVDINNQIAKVSFHVEKNGVVFFELTPIIPTPDRGYDYFRA